MSPFQTASLKAVLSAVSTLCRLRIQGRQVYSTSMGMEISCVLPFLRTLKHFFRSGGSFFFVGVILEATESLVAEVSSRDRLLACWLLSRVLESNPDEILEVLQESQYLKQEQRFLKLLLSANKTAPVLCTERECVSESSSTTKNDHLPWGYALNAKKIPRVSDEHVSCNSTADDSSASAASAELSVSFTLSETKEMAKLLKFCSQAEEKKKYTWVCFIRQLAVSEDIELFQTALRTTRVKIFLVQHIVDGKTKEMMFSHSVFCVDRLGLNTTDRFARKLGCQVYEGTMEWLFAVQAVGEQTSWKCRLSAEQSRAGVIMSIHVRKSKQQSKSAPKSSAKLSPAFFGELSQTCQNANSSDYLSVARSVYVRTHCVLFCFYAAIAFVTVGGKRVVGPESIHSFSVAHYETFDAVLKTIILLCRCEV